MYKKILCAVGGPDASLAPVSLAARIAREDGAGLTILCVYETASSMLGEPYYSDALVPRVSDAERTLEQARQIALREGFETAELEALEGEPADKIVEVAQRGGFDLIVMGTHSRGRIGAAVLGSVSQAVAARAGLPVLVVPARQGGAAD